MINILRNVSSKRTFRQTFTTFFQNALPLHWAAWQMCKSPIQDLPVAFSAEEKQRILEKWMRSLISQLSSVGLIGAIVAAIIVGGFTWPQVSDSRMSGTSFSIVQALWYSALVFAVSAVTTSLHQTVFLHRVSILPQDRLVVTMESVLFYRSSQGIYEPREAQIFIWTAAVGLLEWSIYLWLGGFVVFLWDLTRMGRSDQQWLDTAVAAVCGIAFAVSILVYTFSICQLYFRLWQAMKSRNP